uniref:Uncharacterized protein n=1 Tax=Arundo donax TaxID=35708 RepID=A0A0A8ZZC6_ARUDO
MVTMSECCYINSTVITCWAQNFSASNAT